MAYREDADLEFLSDLSSKDLDNLVYVLTHDKDGGERLTEELMSTDSYKKYYPDHSKYWKEIAAEIQCFGANSFATLFRGGKGVPYREVLNDVYDKLLGAEPSKYTSTVSVENTLLEGILAKTIEGMNEKQLKEFAKDINLDNVTSFNSLSSSMLKQSILASAQAVFKAGGFKSYQLTLIIVNAISKFIFGTGLRFATNAVLTRAASVLAGPIGWFITGAWTAIDLAGPAYRVTIPAVIQIALLRKQHQLTREELEKALREEFDIDSF